MNTFKIRGGLGDYFVPELFGDFHGWVFCGNKFQRGAGLLQQHRPRPGSGGPHLQLCRLQLSFQAGFDHRYAGGQVGDLPDFGSLLPKHMETTLK